MSLLELEDVTISFGGLTAVEGASFAVNPGEVFALVGPNGAGKSTIFNLVSRYCTPSGGDIRFEGKSILGCAPHDIPRLGIARTFQNIELFEHATVLQNLLIGRHTHRRSNAISEILHLPGVRSEERRHRLAAERVIDFLDLQPYRESLIMGLPYGVRKIVELGRALAVEPKLLLLDEPASGLSAEETDDVA
ncbi:MAG: ATP-binding cassette domain-containing protein, partial [Boseongicola sp. SB0667_bin_21]|nr:ATP-binding cassette domain-containing protein [Boseongicola sp. SB0667_bin_21]